MPLETSVDLEAPPWCDAHWLTGIETFRVECDGRGLGYVEEIIEGHGDEDGRIVIEQRLSGGTALLCVAFEDVVDVDPARCLLRVRAESSRARRPAMTASMSRAGEATAQVKMICPPPAIS
jgi:hypothetical protein